MRHDPAPAPAIPFQCRVQWQRGAFTLAIDMCDTLQGITALFGPSGSGKTSLLRCLAGLERPAGGLVRFGDQLWQGDDPPVFVPPFRRPVGFVFQDGRLFNHLTVAGNLAFARQRAVTRCRPATATGTTGQPEMAELIAILALEGLLPRHPMQLSGGERQRVAIARALLTDPALLLMDEPLASVDGVSKQRILAYLRQLHRRWQRPVLYVSHDMGEIMQLADQLLVLEQGRLVARGPVHLLATRLDQPFAHGPEAGALLEATVVGRESAFHLTRLAAGAGLTLHLPDAIGLTTGERVRVRILARDVSLALEKPQHTSILNIFPATVVAIQAENVAQVMVQLDLAGMPLLARVTSKSCAALALQPGLSLFAQVKSVALHN
ncbi:MAG: molybdenum ABC transporter ATP-binding protein [Magnetococcus sp. DMHC-8]